MFTNDSRSCEPLISISDGNAVGGNVENNVDNKLFVVFDIWNKCVKAGNGLFDYTVHMCALVN